MPSTALFDLLPDFGSGAARTVAAASEPPRAAHSVQPPVNVDALVARAVADAEAALQERLEQEHAAAFAAERQANADEAKADLEKLGEDFGKAIAERIDAMEARVSELVGSSVARIIGNLLGDDLRKRSVEALACTIRESIGDSEAVRIGIRGPQSLFTALEAALGDKAVHFEFTDAPGFDLTVVIDDAVFETRMAEWAETLAGALS